MVLSKLCYLFIYNHIFLRIAHLRKRFWIFTIKIAHSLKLATIFIF